jgi:hypothetical protein
VLDHHLLAASWQHSLLYFTCSIVDRDAGYLSIKHRLDLCANAVGIIYFGICDVNVATKVTPFNRITATGAYMRHRFSVFLGFVQA